MANKKIVLLALLILIAIVLMPKAVFAKKTFRPNIIILHKHKVLKKHLGQYKLNMKLGKILPNMKLDQILGSNSGIPVLLNEKNKREFDHIGNFNFRSANPPSNGGPAIKPLLLIYDYEPDEAGDLKSVFLGNGAIAKPLLLAYDYDVEEAGDLK